MAEQGKFSWASFSLGFAKGGFYAVAGFIIVISVYWLLRWLA